MTRIVFAIPGDLAARTGGYEFDRRILAAAPTLGVEMPHIALPGAFPDPSKSDLTLALDAIGRALKPGDVVLADGLACGVFPEGAIRRLPAPVIELCHHPLCLEAGLSAARAAFLRENECEVFAAVAHIVVTSPHTARTLRDDFHAPADRISVALPGSEPAPRARGTGEPITLLALGSVIPRKGFDVLVAALAGLIDLDWRLTIAGGLAHAPETARALRAQISACDLGGRVTLAGELSGDALQAAFDSADVFVSSSLYEGYGMALSEALARGLPIVAATGGAAADTVPDAAALKVPPGDAAALCAALRRVIADGGLRRTMSDESWRAGSCLPRWEDAARKIIDVAQHVRASGT